MTNKSSNPKIKIIEPILDSDYKIAATLVKDNVADWADYDEKYLKTLSSGEILIAKTDDQVVGVLTQRRPGMIFEEMSDEHFALDQIKFPKIDIGYIVLAAVSKAHQGNGIGKLLLQKALELQDEWKAKCVGVHCWKGSPGNSSQKLFESFGFEPLKLHKSPWFEYSKKLGPKKYRCVVCGNPCKCDELEMVKYL